MAEKTATATMEERATRAALRRRGRTARLKPIEEIRPFSMEGQPITGASAYFLRPDGATIADALIFYPNGAVLSQEEDPKRRFSANAEYYQARQRRKGFEYVGHSLTPAGARRLVEILEKNRPAEVERLEDEIALCEYTILNSDDPKARDFERRRKVQLTERLERVTNQFDPDQLVKELDDIANAQEMASLPPQIMRVMKRMLGQAVNEALVARFQRPTAEADDTGLSTQEGVASIG